LSNAALNFGPYGLASDEAIIPSSAMRVWTDEDFTVLSSPLAETLGPRWADS
jgi:hypothetical protein